MARTCRHFGISRQAFYKWKRRFDEHGDGRACATGRGRRIGRPDATPQEVVSKILYLRQNYHFGPGKIADYLKRFHQLVDRQVVRAPHSRRARDEPVAGQSEASAAQATLAALRESRSRATGCSWT